MGGEETRTVDERRQFGAFSFAPVANPEPAPSPAPATLPVRTRRPARWLLPTIRLADLAATLRRAFNDELERGNAFLFVPVFLAIGTLFYFSSTGEPGFVPLLLGIVASGGLSAVARSRPVLRAVCLALLFLLCGAFAAKLETWRASTAMLGSEITTRIVARTVRIEHQASGRVRLTLDLISTERPQLRYAPARVRATARAAPEGIAPGDVVEGVVRLLPPSGPVRPQSYDFAFRSYFDGIGAVGFFLSGPEFAPEGQAAAPLSMRLGAWVERQRQRMATRIETTIGGAEGAIAAALITGIRAGIPEEINEALRVVGLYHVISISGLHMALVAGTLMVALRCGFACAPGFAMRWPVKKFAAGIALAATGFYLLMSGGDVAAQRSFIMLAVMLVAVLFDRAALTMRNLAISAIVILLLSPHEVTGPSFQMSFAATAALVASYAAWTAYRIRKPASAYRQSSPLGSGMRKMAGYAVGLSMTSVVAGLATALFTAWHFQQISPMGLFANLAAMPFVSVIVMPMAVLASLLMPFGLDALPLYLMGQGIAAMNAIAIWLAERSAFDATGPIPLPAVLLLVSALTILTMAGSALRWLSIPPALAGICLLLMMKAAPDVLISEDARLVAVRLADGRIAVNRARPRAFTMQNWQRAMQSRDILRPSKRDGKTAAAFMPESDSGFSCADGLCIARHASGAVVAHAENAEAAARACDSANVLVIDDATAENPCGEEAIVTMTKRDLARRGSAEIHVRPAASGLRIDTSFALSTPYRPWHEHRRYSREARGLAPWKPRPRNETGTPAQ